MARITFDAVSKHYGATLAVGDLSLVCPQGEMLALLGPSGCGKSTTLKMVAGVERPSKGDIRFDDRSVTDLPPGARNIAMVFEDYALYPHMTVEQNIGFPLSIAGVPRGEIARRVEGIVALLDLIDVADQGVRQLSGGAQQRVSIGRALIRDPELILFDEPLSHLDGNQKVQLRSEIKRLQTSAHLTSILVTHDQSEAIAMADRVAVMNAGRLQQVASASEIYAAPANMFVAAFIGEPPMNLLPVGSLDTDANGTAKIVGQDWSATLGGPRGERLAAALRSLSAENITGCHLGIRPEDVRLMGEGVGAISGRVATVEPRGDATVVTVVLDGAGAVGVVSEEEETMAPPPGARVTVEFPSDCLHLFGGDDGANLMTAA